MSEKKIDPTLLRRIKALFERSQYTPKAGATPAEIETWMNEAAANAAMAQELLLRHKLTMEEVLDATAARKQQFFVEEDLNFPKGIREVANWKRVLAGTICRYHFTMAFTTPRGIRFIGAEEDLAITSWLFGYLSEVLIKAADLTWNRKREYLQQYPDRFAKELANKRTGVTFKNNFYLGAIHALGERFKQKRAAEEQEALRARRNKVNDAARDNPFALIARENWQQSEEKALAPWKAAEKRLEDFVKERYPNAADGEDYNFTESSLGGYFEGVREGNRVSLSRPLPKSRSNSTSLLDV